VGAPSSRPWTSMALPIRGRLPGKLVGFLQEASAQMLAKGFRLDGCSGMVVAVG
jgi:hypothetical protein